MNVQRAARLRTEGGRLEDSFPIARSSCSLDHRAGALMGEELADQDVRLAPVHDMHPRRRLQRAQARLGLWDHAAGDGAVRDQLAHTPVGEGWQQLAPRSRMPGMLLR